MHVQDSVCPLNPKVSDQKVAHLFRVYHHSRWVVGLVWIGLKFLPDPYSATWDDEGVVAHVSGRIGLSGQVCDLFT